MLKYKDIALVTLHLPRSLDDVLRGRVASYALGGSRKGMRMLETVDFMREAPEKEEYKAKRDELMRRLTELQQRARAEHVGLVVLFEGWNGAGKGSRISDLMYRLDARSTSVHVTSDLDVAAARSFAGAPWGVQDFFPPMQQFWKSLGERGTITFYDRGWYSASVQRMLMTEIGDDSIREDDEDRGEKGKGGDEGGKGKRSRAVETAAFAREERRARSIDRAVESAAEFERQLVNDGYVLVKFFVHVREKMQRRRLERLYDDPATRWRVSEGKLASAAGYPHAYRLYDRLLTRSDFSFAPWTLINGEEKRSANLKIAETLCEALERALNAPKDEAAAAAEEAAAANSDKALAEVTGAAKPFDGKSSTGAGSAAEDDLHTPDPADDAEAVAASEAIAKLQHSQAPTASRFMLVEDPPMLSKKYGKAVEMDEGEYKKRLKAEQKRLYRLELEMYRKRIPLIVLFEGWDAAGKGGAIKRVAQALDARAYTIFPSPAPTRPELLHPHLWRYWTRLPKAGHVGIYDRSWYGRVLVERIEGFATPAEWGRAYDEINDFERELARWGAILLKFWIDVSPEEQLRRFREREDTPSKRWKITSEDWRNRAKRQQYRSAANDMMRLTSTPFAPWAIVPGDDKKSARIEVISAIADALEARLRSPEDSVIMTA